VIAVFPLNPRATTASTIGTKTPNEKQPLSAAKKNNNNYLSKMMTQIKLGFTVAVSVAVGILSAQAIQVTLSKIHYASNPCDRPNLPASMQATCEFKQSGERMRKELADLKAEREAKEKQ
jgi:hypothetical protein